jgi:flavin reductase (DIM6/NTAB) family NADH-FMN oxidoreductase RutF
MYLKKDDLANLDRKYRLNLINSVTGIKPANLIGTQSESASENLAIFSSVIHLGSNPPLLGFVLRPVGEVPRNTYENLKESGVYTINSVPLSLIKNAHYTSAKFDSEVNEFDRCNIQSEYINGFKAPYVSDSPIKIGLEFREEIPIRLNGTTLIIGEIVELTIKDSIIAENGYLDLDSGEIAGISGLNSYYELKKKEQFPYVRLQEVPEF